MGCKICTNNDKTITLDVKVFIPPSNSSSVGYYPNYIPIHTHSTGNVGKRIVKHIFIPHIKNLRGKRKEVQSITDQLLPDSDCPQSSQGSLPQNSSQLENDPPVDQQIKLSNQGNEEAKIEIIADKEINEGDGINKKQNQKDLDSGFKSSARRYTNVYTARKSILSLRNHISNQISIDCSLFKGEHQGKISDHYKILARLGKGSYGAVYKAKHLITQDIRAIKIVSKKLISSSIDPEIEFEILKMLDHPNILRFYEYFQDHKSYYLVTEFCNGHELLEQIVQMKHLSERKVSKIMQQVFSAINYCHNHNIIHRDIKPENLLYERKSSHSMIKVIDFGGSLIFDKNIKSKLTDGFGTPYYVAPEVLEHNYDEKCDIWSCGVIMYSLLYGRPPFIGRTVSLILNAISKGIYSLANPENTQISKEAKSLISRMLELNTRRRISAHEALNHTWIVQKTRAQSPSKIIAENALFTFQNLQRFNVKQKLQEAVILFLVTQMQSTEDEIKLRAMFEQLDKNKDGQLSREELISGYEIIFGNRELAIIETDHLLHNFDINHNGKLDYTEFIVANTNINNLLQEKNLQAAFERFDLDGNGKITIEELTEILGNGMDIEDSDKFFKDLITQVDIDGDGQINYEEFKTMMLSLKKRRISALF